MSKKIIGLLLVLCMVVGLLPVVALADATDGKATILFGTTKCELTGFDTPVYTKNVSKEVKDTDGELFTHWAQTTTGASADDWNAKVEWKSGEAGPTITLKGLKMDDYNNTTGKLRALLDEEGNFTYYDDGDKKTYQTYAITTPKGGIPCTIIITGEDSLIETKFGITYYGNTTIKSEGDAKLTMHCNSATLSSNNTAGAALTVNANLDLLIRSYYGTALGAANIQTYKADLTIEGGNIKAAVASGSSVKNISAQGGGNVIINGGNLDLSCTLGTSGTTAAIMAPANKSDATQDGKVIINGGDVKINVKGALGIYGAKGVEINNGNVVIDSTWYGINANGGSDIKLNGGSVEITTPGGVGVGAFYDHAPIVASNMEAYAGTTEDDADFFDESKFRAGWFKATASGSGSQGGNTTTGTKPTETKPAETKPGETKPAETKPAGTTGNNNPGTGDNNVAMFSALLLVAAFGVVATVAFSKKNSIVE